MAPYYDDLLQLCGFEPEAIKDERQRVEAAFARLGIGPDDMAAADAWVRQNHDVSLAGVRKLLGAWLKELIDVVLAKDEGKKVVYFGFPAMLGPGLLINAASEDVYVCAPDMVLCHTMGQIFNKLDPIIAAGEENGLPPGHALCSLWKIKIGAVAMGMIPVPDLALASSYFCDMGSKADDLVTALFGTPVAYIDGVMDSQWGEYPDFLPERVQYLGAQINQAFEKAEQVLGIKIAPETYGEARAVGQAFVSRLVKLAGFMRTDPVPVSFTAIELLEALSGSSTGRGIHEGVKAMDILIEEIRQRVAAGVGATKKGVPRVMISFGHMSDPRVTRLVEDSGLAVPLTLVLNAIAGPPAEPEMNYQSPGEMVAAHELAGGFFHSTYGINKRMEEALEVMKLDGFIANYIYCCRPSALQSHITRDYLEAKTGVPVLSLEQDIYDSSAYTADSMRTRVETFADMLRDRKINN